jgi:glycosyltransferase involved in cell wall biosynthesis
MKKSSNRSTEKINILLFSLHFWPESFRINNLAISLSKKSNLDVLTGKPNYPFGIFFDGYNYLGWRKQNHRGLSIFRLPMYPRKSANFFFLIINYFSFIFSAFLFAPWILRNKKYDFIFVYATSPLLQALPAIFIGKIKSAKVILWVQDLWPESVSATGFIKNQFVLNMIDLLVKLIYRKVDLILVASKAFVRSIEQKAPDLKILYYPNSIDRLINTPLNFDKDFLVRIKNKFLVLYTGNIGKAQSLDTLIMSAHLLKNYKKIHFLIVGDGSEKLRLLALVKKLNLKNVDFLDQKPEKYMLSLMKMSSVLFLSLRKHPIFSLTVPAKLQTYMISGRPIVACLSGESARIIKDSSSGYVASPENPLQLAKAIKSMSKLPIRIRCMMGSNAKNFAIKNFDHNLLTNQLLNYLKNFKAK